jgi:hypothetical protein
MMNPHVLRMLHHPTGPPSVLAGQQLLPSGAVCSPCDAPQAAGSLKLADELLIEEVHAQLLMGTLRQVITAPPSHAKAGAPAGMLDVLQSGLCTGANASMAMSLLLGPLKCSSTGLQNAILQRLPTPSSVQQLLQLQGTVGTYTWDIKDYLTKDDNEVP